MKKSFKKFLSNRPTLNKECNHAQYEWCQNCLNFPQLVTQKFPDGTVTTGYYQTNKPKHK